MNIELKISGEELKKKLNIQDGKDYVLTAKDKKEIAQGIKVPVVEKVIEKRTVEKPIEIVKEVAVKDKPDEVVEKINKAKVKIKAKQVEGLNALLKESEEREKFPVGKDTGGGRDLTLKAGGVRINDHVTSLNFGTGFTATYAGEGQVNVTSSFPRVEDLSAQCNGILKAFTLSSPATGVLMLSGTQFPNIYRPTVDFSLTDSTTITLTAEVGAVESGQTLIALVY